MEPGFVREMPGAKALCLTTMLSGFPWPPGLFAFSLPGSDNWDKRWGSGAGGRRGGEKGLGRV